MKKKYQDIMGNKKLRLILTASILALVTIASTYAWWTASTDVKQTVSMGNLKIEAEFADADGALYEPETYVELNGWIKNTGTIPTIVRVVNNSSIKFAYEEDMTLISEANRVEENIDPDAVQINLEPTSGDYYENESEIIWLEDSNSNRYILIEPGSRLLVDLQIKFDGPNVSNRYMDSIISAKAQIKATQVIEGAILAELGVDSDELVPVNSSTTRMAVSKTSKGMERLKELLARGK